MSPINASRFRCRETNNKQQGVDVPQQPLEIAVRGKIRHDYDDSDSDDDDGTVCPCGALVPSSEADDDRDLVRLRFSCGECSKGVIDTPRPPRFALYRN